jgi:hypothetical protein
VGTEKRERQKANRAMRREEELRAARASAVKRTTLRWIAVVVAGLAAIVLIAWVGGAFDGDDTPAVPPPPIATSPVETLPVETLPVETSPDTSTP